MKTIPVAEIETRITKKFQNTARFWLRTQFMISGQGLETEYTIHRHGGGSLTVPGIAFSEESIGAIFTTLLGKNTLGYIVNADDASYAEPIDIADANPEVLVGEIHNEEDEFSDFYLTLTFSDEQAAMIWKLANG